ncbi:hypothetical protein HDV00_009130 [Rhizophlyctis rosea]|nr:hypothetical protein HDV00_009130 [Rhizophlyctis rosea]
MKTFISIATLVATLLTLSTAAPAPAPIDITPLTNITSPSSSSIPQLQTTTLGYDPTYDTATLSTLTIACSDGPNGLSTKGYKTLSQLPSFPNITASFNIAGWNSAKCGSCYVLKYKGKSVYVTGVDHAAEGFISSMGAMDALTGGQAEAMGRVDVQWGEVAGRFCGF